MPDIPGLIDFRTGSSDSNGRLELSFTFRNNRHEWRIQQVALEAPSAPDGAQAEIRYQGQLVSPAPTPRRASAAGEPWIYLKAGETLSVIWENMGSGIFGNATIYYERVDI